MSLPTPRTDARTRATRSAAFGTSHAVLDRHRHLVSWDADFAAEIAGAEPRAGAPLAECVAAAGLPDAAAAPGEGGYASGPTRIGIRERDLSGGAILRIANAADLAPVRLGNAARATLGSIAAIRRRTEAELREARDAAESASRAKSEFLANMSHEIRTPLNAIIGFADMIRTETFGPIRPERYRTYIDDIHFSGSHLLRVIGDILDLAKLEASPDALEWTQVSVGEEIAAVAHLFEAAVAAKGLAFDMSVADGLPGHVVADRTRLRQVLLNLVANAIKFTPAGRVGLHALPRAGGRPGVRFEVRDQGIGIAPEAQARLFSNFVQADASIPARFGGIGLGLAISKKLVAMMGGTIGVDSAPGLGSVFWVEFPAQSAAGVA
jgi:signal transduction histidine kinase